MKKHVQVCKEEQEIGFYDSYSHRYHSLGMTREISGLVVMGGDSCSKDCKFESWHHILDGDFFTFICCKNCNVCLKRKNKLKRGRGLAHLKNKDFLMKETLLPQRSLN